MIASDLEEAPLVTRTPGHVVDFVLPSAMKRARRESFYVVALGSTNLVLGVRCVARGFVDQCPVDPREVFRCALMKMATGIIVAHNHPSGDPTPSSKDFELTRQLKSGAELLGFRLVDHIIVAKGGSYHSFAEHGGL